MRPPRPIASVYKRQIPTEHAEARIAETGRLLIIYSGARWDSGGGGQRPQQMATALAPDACVVHLAKPNPFHMPTTHDEVIVRRSTEWQTWTGLEADRKVFCAAFPDHRAAEIASALPSDWGVVYDCIDAWADFQLPSYEQKDERDIIRRADLVACTARELVSYVKGLGIRRPPPIYFLPNSTQLVGQEIVDGPRDVDCIFVGHLVGGWVHWHLMGAVADSHSLRIIGAPPGHLPFEHPNAEWAGLIPNGELLRHLARAKVGIIPFRDIPLVRAVWPIKYADYLAAGLPTVASYLPELEGEPHARVCYGFGDFLNAVDEALATEQPREAMMREAHNCTAEARAEQLAEWLEAEGLW